MPSTVLSAATIGIEAYPVHVEVDTDRTLPTFTVVGLPDSTFCESTIRHINKCNISLEKCAILHYYDTLQVGRSVWS